MVHAEKRLPQAAEEPTSESLALHQNPLSLVFLICALFYLISLALSMRLETYNPVVTWWAPAPAIMQYMGVNTLEDTLLAREFWRLILTPFLHINLIHIFFMLLLTGYVGTLSLLNLNLDRKRFWITLFASGLLGGLCSLAWQYGIAGSYPSLGLSPIIFGFLAMNYSQCHAQFDLLLAKRFQQMLILAHSAALLLAVSGLVNVDHAAHIGGMVAGYVCGWSFHKKVKKQDPPSPIPMLYLLLEHGLLFVCVVGFLYGCFEVILNILPFFPSN